MTTKNDNDTNEPAFDLDSFLNDTEVPPKVEDKDFEILEAFLESHESPMDLEVLDGFLCALICGPDAPDYEAFIPYIFGGKAPEFSSSEQSEQILGILTTHWEHIEGSLQKDVPYYPFLYSDGDFKVNGNNWALGFVLGLDKFRDSWAGLVEEAQSPEALLAPILALYFENAPENTEGPIHAEDREIIVTNLVENLPKIYNYFEEERQKKQGTLH